MAPTRPTKSTPVSPTITPSPAGRTTPPLEIGYQLYWYPERQSRHWRHRSVSRSHEFHIGATYDTTKLLSYNLSPSLFYYHDVILDSNTLQLGLAYSYDLSDMLGVKGISINPSANLGWTGIGRNAGDQAPGRRRNWKNSYTYWQLDLELDYKLNTSTTFFTAAHYAGNSDGDTGWLRWRQSLSSWLGQQLLGSASA